MTKIIKGHKIIISEQPKRKTPLTKKERLLKEWNIIKWKSHSSHWKNINKTIKEIRETPDKVVEKWNV